MTKKLSSIPLVIAAVDRGSLSVEDAAEEILDLLPLPLRRAVRDSARTGWTPPRGFTAADWRVAEETPVSQMMGHDDDDESGK